VDGVQRAVEFLDTAPLHDDLVEILDGTTSRAMSRAYGW
jgi:hypothetical protein